MATKNEALQSWEATLIAGSAMLIWGWLLLKRTPKRNFGLFKISEERAASWQRSSARFTIALGAVTFLVGAVGFLVRLAL